MAVKILTDAGGGGSRVSGGGGADGSAFSTAAWDKVRLEKLLHEVRGVCGFCLRGGEGDLEAVGGLDPNFD